jgi:hypothetical protein
MSTSDPSDGAAAPKPVDSIERKLAEYRARIEAAGLSDDSVTAVMVDILGDVVKGYRDVRIQYRRICVSLAIAGLVFLVGAYALSNRIVRAINRDPSPASLAAAGQISDAVNRLDAATKRIEEAASLNNASAESMIKAVDGIPPIASELSESRRAFDAARVQPAPAVPPKN